MHHHRTSKAWTASLALLALVLVTTTSACAHDNASAEGGPVSVGIVCGGMTPMATQVAINADTFGKQVTVEKVCFDDGSTAVKALVGGSIDVFMGSVEHVLTTRAAGQPIKAYAGINNRAPYALITAASSDVRSVADLKGEAVGVTESGSLSDTELHQAAVTQGVAYDDMQVIGAGSGSTMSAAISQEKVAAGMVSEPQKSAMVASGDYRVVWEPTTQFAAIVAVANSDWVKANRDDMRAFLQGVSEAASKTQQDTSFAVQAMRAEKFGVPQGILENAVREGARTIPAGLRVSPEVYRSTAEVLTQAGVVDQADVAPYGEVFDFSLLGASS